MHYIKLAIYFVQIKTIILKAARGRFWIRKLLWPVFYTLLSYEKITAIRLLEATHLVPPLEFAANINYLCASGQKGNL